MTIVISTQDVASRAAWLTIPEPRAPRTNAAFAIIFDEQRSDFQNRLERFQVGLDIQDEWNALHDQGKVNFETFNRHYNRVGHVFGIVSEGRPSVCRHMMSSTLRKGVSFMAKVDDTFYTLEMVNVPEGHAKREAIQDVYSLVRGLWRYSGAGFDAIRADLLKWAVPKVGRLTYHHILIDAVKVNDLMCRLQLEIIRVYKEAK